MIHEKKTRDGGGRWSELGHKTLSLSYNNNDNMGLFVAKSGLDMMKAMREKPDV